MKISSVAVMGLASFVAIVSGKPATAVVAARGLDVTDTVRQDRQHMLYRSPSNREQFENGTPLEPVDDTAGGSVRYHGFAYGTIETDSQGIQHVAGASIAVGLGEGLPAITPIVANIQSFGKTATKSELVTWC